MAKVEKEKKDPWAYFEFYPTIWQNFKISRCKYPVKGFFMDVCAYYWNNKCEMTIDDLKEKFSSKTEKKYLTVLIQKKIIKQFGEKISISFLNEHLEYVQWKSSKARDSANVKHGKGEVNTDANAQRTHSERTANVVLLEESREEKIRVEESIAHTPPDNSCCDPETVKNWTIKNEKFVRDLALVCRVNENTAREFLMDWLAKSELTGTLSRYPLGAIKKYIISDLDKHKTQHKLGITEDTLPSVDQLKADAAKFNLMRQRP